MMKPVFAFRLLFFVFSCLPVSAYSQEIGTSGVGPLKPEGSYTGELVNNLAGGIQTGSCYLGMANLPRIYDSV